MLRVDVNPKPPSLMDVNSWMLSLQVNVRFRPLFEEAGSDCVEGVCCGGVEAYCTCGEGRVSGGGGAP